MSAQTDNRWLKFILVLLITFGIGFYLYHNLESYEYEKEDLNQDYYRNDFFILQTFLESLDLDITVSKNNADIFTLNEQVKNLALFESSESYTRASNPKIRTWIQDGGTLITTLTHSPEDGELDFFSEFNANNYEAETDDYSDIGCYSENGAFFDCDNQDVITVSTEHKVLASNRYGNAALELPYGDGKIILLAHSYGFENKRVTDKDNAFFLSSLLNTDNAGKTLIIYDAYRSSFTAALWRNAKLSIILFISLVILLLWSLIQRFGPFKRPEMESQQDLKQHLQACANYAWERDKLHQQVKLSRASLLHLIRVRTGRKLPEEPQALNKFIQDYIEQMHIELDGVDLHNTLFGNLPNDESNLIRISTQLQTLRSKL